MQSTQPSLSTAQKSAPHVSNLFMTSPEAMVVTRPNGSILAVNPAFCQLFGVSEEEIFAADHFVFADPRDGRLLRMMARCQKDGQAWGKATFIRGDGTLFEGEALIYLIQDATGQSQIIGRFRTVRPSPVGEPTFQELETQLDILFHSMPFPAALFTLPEGTIQDVNGAFQQLFGYTRREALGKTSADLGLTDLEGRLARLTLLNLNHRIGDPEITAYTRHGHPLSLLIYVNTLLLNKKYFAMVYLINLTERAQLEATLRASE